MQKKSKVDVVETARLSLSDINLTHAPFILELLNTSGWLTFIGERNVKSLEDANSYIKKIQESKTINYWVVSIKESHAPIGVITYIKRAYLSHWDIGFAFLPQYANQGYAYEAAKQILKEVLKQPFSNRIVATTMKENIHSIKLLEKLGLSFQEEIQVEEKTLLLYGESINKLKIN